MTTPSTSRTPFTTASTWPASINPTRLAAHIQTQHHSNATYAILGAPDDTGVRLNNGRPGAALGPTAFRAALATYGVASPSSFSYPTIYDAGDVIPATPSSSSPQAALDAFLETHNRLFAATSWLLERNLFPVLIGGGHDLTLPFFRANIAHLRATQPTKPINILNIDPHLDCRETPGSGMAFHTLLSDLQPLCANILGFNPLVNSKEHTSFFQAKSNGHIITTDHFRANPASIPSLVKGTTLATFDIDAIDMAFAPGVSALNPNGFHPHEAEHIVATIAKDPALRAIDFMEFSPPNDPSGRTARLVAHLFLTFLANRPH